MVRLHRKIHFVIMNMSIIDIFFYGTRNLIHTNYNGAKYDIIFSSLAYTAAVYDMFNIGYTCMTTGLKTTSIPIEEKSDSKKSKKKLKNSKEASLNESRFKLKEHETDKKHFKMLKKGNFGLRPVFWDADIDKYNFTTREQLRRIGYKKVISYEETTKLTRTNHVIEAYARSELRDDPDVYSRFTTLLGNYFFLVRVLFYQFTIVSLCQNPLVLIPMLMIIEGFYMIINIWNYCKLKHLKDFRLFCSKLSQSFCLFVFLLFCMTLAFNVGIDKKPVSLDR